jgi:hypothetical protein
MKKNIIVVLALCTMAACNSNETKPTETVKTDSTVTIKDKKDTAAMADMYKCYGYATLKDTVKLHIMAMGNTVTGDAVFQYAGKDKNTGTLSGEMKGDTLLASYKFISEGKESVREVAFIKKGDSFSEGYGDAEEKAGGMIFKNTQTLKFTGKALEKMDCKK